MSLYDDNNNEIIHIFLESTSDYNNSDSYSIRGIKNLSREIIFNFHELTTVILISPRKIFRETLYISRGSNVHSYKFELNIYTYSSN